MNRFIINLFNLHQGEDDRQKTLEHVKKNISFSGANLWILACAIIIASVGLNVNSTAVIIGAMLISPLMGPIVASGFALGMYDFDLLKKSLRNLLIATIAGLLFSSIYFYLSPFKEVQSELLARTSPNIYDIFIAFFGGLVGVIAVTRVEKGNPIPGVAIATALMPPLCTSGYGLATGNFHFFFGALFLYTINCVFIGIATFLVVKYLNYPAKQDINAKHQKQIKYGITTITVILLLPAVYFAYSLYAQQKFVQNLNNFLDKEFIEKGYTIVYKKTNFNSNPKTVELAFLSDSFNSNDSIAFNRQLLNYGLANTQLIIKHNDNLLSLKSDILNEVNKSDNVLNEKDKRIQDLENQLRQNTYTNIQLLNEIKAVFPDISSIIFTNQDEYFLNDSIKKVPIFIYQSNKELTLDEKEKLNNWMKQKYSLGNIQIFKQK